MHKSFAPPSKQITTPAPYHLIFTGRLLCLTPSQRCHSTEGTDRCYLLLDMLIGQLDTCFWLIDRSFSVMRCLCLTVVLLCRALARLAAGAADRFPRHCWWSVRVVIVQCHVRQVANVLTLLAVTSSSLQFVTCCSLFLYTPLSFDTFYQKQKNAFNCSRHQRLVTFAFRHCV